MQPIRHEFREKPEVEVVVRPAELDQGASESNVYLVLPSNLAEAALKTTLKKGILDDDSLRVYSDWQLSAEDDYFLLLSLDGKSAAFRVGVLPSVPVEVGEVRFVIEVASLKTVAVSKLLPEVCRILMGNVALARACGLSQEDIAVPIPARMQVSPRFLKQLKRIRRNISRIGEGKLHRDSEWHRFATSAAENLSVAEVFLARVHELLWSKKTTTWDPYSFEDTEIRERASRAFSHIENLKVLMARPHSDYSHCASYLRSISNIDEIVELALLEVLLKKRERVGPLFRQILRMRSRELVAEESRLFEDVEKWSILGMRPPWVEDPVIEWHSKFGPLMNFQIPDFQQIIWERLRQIASETLVVAKSKEVAA